jgi:hypothetical protein
LTLLYRASEHDFLASKFHELCDGNGHTWKRTITLVKDVNGPMAAAYNGRSWELNGDYHWVINPCGFIASIAEDAGMDGVHTLHKYAANEGARALSDHTYGPYFGMGLAITDRCNMNSLSSSFVLSEWGYGPEGLEPASLFSSVYFKVLEYEVFEVKIHTI